MKKIGLIVFSLLLITLISGCGKLSEKEIFEYNIECQKLLETYKKEHNGTIQEEGYTFLVSDMNAFYSPKENTCLLSSKYYENRSSGSRVEYGYTIRTLYGPEKLSRYQEIYENDEKGCFGNSDFDDKIYYDFDCNEELKDVVKLWEDEIERLSSN